MKRSTTYTRRLTGWPAVARFAWLMATILAVLTALGAIFLLLAEPAGATRCVYEGPDPDARRVFADVPSSHPLCVEIESLYRDGLTSGCGTNEDGELLFCPDQPITRAMAAAFAEHRDPFAQVDLDGRLRIADHVVNADHIGEGSYTVHFSRDIQRCSVEAWSRDLESPGVEVDAELAWGLVDTLTIETTINGSPVDMAFSVRVHCR